MKPLIKTSLIKSSLIKSTLIKKLSAAFTAALVITSLFIATSEATDIIYTPEQKKDLGFEISRELRCPTSVNQSLFDSNASIANELKGHIFRLLDEGKSKQDVIDYFTERYGEQIRYSPDLSGSTALLWFGPGLFLLFAIGGCVWFIRKNKDL